MPITPFINISSPNNSVSPILLGDIFWSAEKTTIPGKLYSGETYSWLDNPKLKALYDISGHSFIVDNGSTFDVLDYNGFLRSIPSTSSVSEAGNINGEIVTADGNGSGDPVREAYFGIYGDAAVVAVDTTLAAQGTIALPSNSEFATTQDIANTLNSLDISPTNVFNLDGGTTIDETTFDVDTLYLGYTLNTSTNVLTLAGDYSSYSINTVYTTIGGVSNTVRPGSNEEFIFYLNNNSLYINPLYPVSNGSIYNSSTSIAPSQKQVADEFNKLGIIEFSSNAAPLDITTYQLNREYIGIYTGSGSGVELIPSGTYGSYTIESSFPRSLNNRVLVNSTLFKFIFSNSTFFAEPYTQEIDTDSLKKLSRIVSLREFGWNTGNKAQWTAFPINGSHISYIDTNIFNFSTTVDGRFTVLEEGDYWININYTTDPIGTNAKFIFSLRENNLTGNEIVYFARGFTAVPGGSQNWGTSGATLVHLNANQTVQVASFTDFNPVPGRFAALGVVKIG